MTTRSTLLRRVDEQHRVRLLREEDIAWVEAIVNWSYRGILPTIDVSLRTSGQPTAAAEGGKGGQWTTESHLLAGPRVTRDELKRLLQLDPVTQAAVLVLEEKVSLGGHDDGEDGGEEEGEGEWQVVGSVLMEKEGDEAHLGMFTIHPLRQGSGLGRKLLAAGEEHGVGPAGRGMGCSKVVLHVLAQREDLLDFYQRRGYELLPADSHPLLTFPDGLGRSLLPPEGGQLHFRILVKPSSRIHDA